ncbi:UNVERIFIED_CONTAM: hypothetical protein FKN15_073948 [Acipenser sinensis]
MEQVIKMLAEGQQQLQVGQQLLQQSLQAHQEQQVILMQLIQAMSSLCYYYGEQGHQWRETLISRHTGVDSANSLGMDGKNAHTRTQEGEEPLPSPEAEGEEPLQSPEPEGEELLPSPQPEGEESLLYPEAEREEPLPSPEPEGEEPLPSPEPEGEEPLQSPEPEGGGASAVSRARGGGASAISRARGGGAAAVSRARHAHFHSLLCRSHSVLKEAHFIFSFKNIMISGSVQD